VNAAFWRGECWLPANTLLRWLSECTVTTQAWTLHGDAGAWWVLDQLVIAGYVYQQDRAHGLRVKLAHPLSPEQLHDVIVVLVNG